MKKNFYLFVLVFIFTLILTLTIGYLKNEGSQYRALIFTTIGVVNEPQTYDHVQGAAYFAETIQGWLKNPVLIEKILNKNPASINVYRQERQNMVIEITANNQDYVVTVAHNLIDNLQNSIQEYNKMMNTHFLLLHQGTSLSEVGTQAFIFIIGAALIVAISLGFLSVFLKENYFTQ